MNALYNKLRNAGFSVEHKGNKMIVSLTNRPVYIYEVKIVTNYDWRFSYERDGLDVVVKRA